MARPLDVGRGYADPAFASSYRTIGPTVTLPTSGATVLLVDEPLTGRCDAVAPYPLLSCRAPERIVDDLGTLRDLGAITFSAVLDPLRPIPGPGSGLDLLRPFKTHLLTRLGPLAEEGRAFRPSRHHQREVSRARREVVVDVQHGVAADPDDWFRLLHELERPTPLAGSAAVDRVTLEAQFALAGAYVMWARAGGASVAAQLVLVTEDVVHAHLAVSDTRGRASRAMYALDAALLDLLDGSNFTVHWGGCAGATDVRDGLWHYKSGWANDSAIAPLVGAVLDPEAYARLGGQRPVDPTMWFPAHRAPSRRPGSADDHAE